MENLVYVSPLLHLSLPTSLAKEKTAYDVIMDTALLSPFLCQWRIFAKRFIDFM
jgi:hypothetical protein